jgi:hypothetical protein
MSKPIEGLRNGIDGAINEITSAMSALNMEPEPLKNTYGNGLWLSETDAWVSHAYEHLKVAQLYCSQGRKEKEDLVLENNLLKEENKRLKKEILELRQTIRVLGGGR